jgi:hypothetical protein
MSIKIHVFHEFKIMGYLGGFALEASFSFSRAFVQE